MARRGDEVALEPRRVMIYGIDVISYTWPHLELQLYCGKGTYIRSLARDLGEKLGCGGALSPLRRTRGGPVLVAGARARVAAHAGRSVFGGRGRCAGRDAGRTLETNPAYGRCSCGITTNGSFEWGRGAPSARTSNPRGRRRGRCSF